MSNAKFNDGLIDQTMELLCRRASRRQPGDQPRPLPAIVLGRSIKFVGGHESVRRKVRGLVKYMRDECKIMIVAGPRGYWLPVDSVELAEYIDRRQRTGRQNMAVAGNVKRSQAASDAAGQMSLF